MNTGQSALVVLPIAGSATAQTVTVDTARDDVDFGGARMVADLPGPDGRVSFREAPMATDYEPGPQTIAFALAADPRPPSRRATLLGRSRAYRPT